MSSQSSAAGSSYAQQAMLECALQVLDQPIALLAAGSVGDEQMSATSSLIPSSTVGVHLRHAHDHFRLLLESLGSSASASAVALDYDCRTPAPAFERSAETARAELLKIKRQLQQAFGEHAELMEKEVRLAATTPARLDFGTTVGRELWFVCLHAIHHYAFIRAILSGELGIDVGPEFGVAPSTLVNKAFRSQGKM
ncbi:hypothetical protein FA09DRAFT_359638 [Tilletiopsis washingtonensis]|uniref:DinB-like domain-containing protein n=1 Tax=Tilletiopsis washingtonensis TaxID=58919 RepID=A0A316ZD98_9BASI|nr:hypothetical protein FA09DRAFT_359638 [Tilletiopsis washingtonensis]PWN99028.1 hypothetical protein FA09DRAFT_359638 [Tilletiopsis washingtonensis]